MGESLIFTDDWSKAKREMSIHTIPRAEGYPTAVYASVMTSLTLSSLGTFYNYARSKDLHKINDIPYPRLRVAADTPTYQPLVHVNCHDTVFGGDWDRVDIEFPGLQSAWMDDSEYVQDPYILAADSQIFDSLSNNETRFSWLKDTREDSSSSLLAVAIYPTATKNDTHEIYQGWIVVACSVDARWAANTAMYQPKNGTLAISNISNSVLETLGQQNSEDSKEKRTNLGISEKPVDIPLDWGSLLNGNHSVTLDEGDGNVTTFPAMEYILSMTQDSYDNSSNITTFLSLNTTDSSLSDEIVGTTSILLGAILADGIANTGASAGSWYAAENTNKTVNKRYKATFLSIFTNYYYTDELPGYSIRIEADRYGYGWTLRAGKTFFFAISCLLFYAMVVFFHIGFIIFDILTNRYLYGECWENVGDLIALATNSRPTPRLYGTSAGIDRRETWRDIVKVRECEENHLELCFVSDARDEMGQSLRRDKAYH